VSNLSEINAFNPFRGLSTGPMALKASVPYILHHRQGAVGQDAGPNNDGWTQGELSHPTRPGDPSRTSLDEKPCTRANEVSKWAEISL
jgi:hypothetical protein